MEKPFVLLAEDNDATCTLIQALLRNEFVVDIARDGLQAIEKLKSRHYAAIVLDLRMPIADGFAVLDFMAAERADLMSRALVVTASLSPRELERVSQYPVAGVIRKPFEVDVLQNAVRRCAQPHGEPHFRAPLLSGSMLLLLADLLRRV
ncbi:MAG TPA: response regulator [Thermoanaerobaculia bacterium]|nr:response regulator [Thermoanaerobaculia bacterium]